MKQHLITSIVLSSMAMLMLFSCNEETYIPKPQGYFRVALPEPNYQTLNEACPYQFEYSENTQLNHPKPDSFCWLDIRYPKYKATVHLTYKAIDQSNLESHSEDARTFAMKHVVKANDIEELTIYDSESKVYGAIYDFEGAVASNFQFYLTDSVQHFLRGALYFEVEPNQDSLRPIETYVEKDIMHLIESFEWK